MPPLVQNSKLLLISTRLGCNPCTKFGIDQVKGSKVIERTTHWPRKSGLTLTFEHLTWKSIGIIYSLRATPASSLVLIKWRGQKILNRQHTGLEREVWPWPLQTKGTLCHFMHVFRTFSEGIQSPSDGTFNGTRVEDNNPLGISMKRRLVRAARETSKFHKWSPFIKSRRRYFADTALNSILWSNQSIIDLYLIE